MILIYTYKYEIYLYIIYIYIDMSSILIRVVESPPPHPKIETTSNSFFDCSIWNLHGPDWWDLDQWGARFKRPRSWKLESPNQCNVYPPSLNEHDNPPPPKTNMSTQNQWHRRCIFLLKWSIFRWHVNFQRGMFMIMSRSFQNKINTHHDMSPFGGLKMLPMFCLLSIIFRVLLHSWARFRGIDQFSVNFKLVF